jgi:hypothetical protein
MPNQPNVLFVLLFCCENPQDEKAVEPKRILGTPVILGSKQNVPTKAEPAVANPPVRILGVAQSAKETPRSIRTLESTKLMNEHMEFTLEAPHKVTTSGTTKEARMTKNCVFFFFLFRTKDSW